MAVFARTSEPKHTLTRSPLADAGDSPRMTGMCRGVLFSFLVLVGFAWGETPGYPTAPMEGVCSERLDSAHALRIIPGRLKNCKRVPGASYDECDVEGGEGHLNAGPLVHRFVLGSGTYFHDSHSTVMSFRGKVNFQLPGGLEFPRDIKMTVYTTTNSASPLQFGGNLTIWDDNQISNISYLCSLAFTVNP